MTVEDVLSNFHVRQYCPWEIVPEGGSRFRAYIQSDHTPAAERMMLGLFTSREHAQSACAQQSPVVWLDEKLDENRRCKLCQAGFALLRRVHHCRNCGACVCAECSSVSWPSRMVPPTYVHVGEKRVRVCDACHFFFERFRKSLLEGNIDEVVATYSTGNCNLVCPFALYEGNHFPLHAAAQGGSLDVVKFLVEVELVPLYFVRGGKTVPYTTSSGMTVLALAAREKAMDVVRYLVTERRVQMDQVQDVKDLQDMCSWLLREVWGKEGEKGGGGARLEGAGGMRRPLQRHRREGGAGGGMRGHPLRRHRRHRRSRHGPATWTRRRTCTTCTTTRLEKRRGRTRGSAEKATEGAERRGGTGTLPPLLPLEATTTKAASCASTPPSIASLSSAATWSPASHAARLATRAPCAG
jgi:hypothetical protein